MKNNYFPLQLLFLLLITTASAHALPLEANPIIGYKWTFHLTNHPETFTITSKETRIPLAWNNHDVLELNNGDKTIYIPKTSIKYFTRESLYKDN